MFHSDTRARGAVFHSDRGRGGCRGCDGEEGGGWQEEGAQQTFDDDEGDDEDDDRDDDDDDDDDDEACRKKYQLVVCLEIMGETVFATWFGLIRHFYL